MNGHDDARALMEGECDIRRVYIRRNARFTVGDLVVAAKKPELADFIRNHGGVFPAPPVKE